MNRRQFLYRTSLLSLAATGLPHVVNAGRKIKPNGKFTDLYVSEKRHDTSDYVYAIETPEAKMFVELENTVRYEMTVWDYGNGHRRPTKTIFNLSTEGGPHQIGDAIVYSTTKPWLVKGKGTLPKEFPSIGRLEITPKEFIMLKVEQGMIKLAYQKPDEEDNSPNFSNQSSDCFLTTACVTAMGLPDDCAELLALRGYRDSYLKQTEAGKALVTEYYHWGPLIVAAINSRTNSLAIYEELYGSLVLPSLAYIRVGALAEARDYYQAYSQTLKEIFVPD